MKWDATARKYVTDSGGLIDRRTVRTWVANAQASSKEYLTGLTQDMIDGKISSSDWVIGFTKEIKDSRTANAVLINGGRDQMTVSDWGKLGSDLREEYGNYKSFWLAVENDELSDAQTMQRAGMYADSIGRNFEGLLRDREIAAGAGFAVNISGDTAQSCNECDELSAAGPIPVSEMPEPGERECGPGCGCSVEYYDTADDSEAA